MCVVCVSDGFSISLFWQTEASTAKYELHLNEMMHAYTYPVAFENNVERQNDEQLNEWTNGQTKKNSEIAMESDQIG